MVFGDRLSFDLELENGVLRYIPQDQYLQTGSAIGIARDREPPPLPKAIQTPSKLHPRKHPAAPKPSLQKTPATVKEASPTSAHNQQTIPLLVFKYTVLTEMMTRRIHLHL